MLLYNATIEPNDTFLKCSSDAQCNPANFVLSYFFTRALIRISYRVLRRSPTLGQGATAPKPPPCPKYYMKHCWTKVSAYRCKNERSVAFKNTPKCVSGWGSGTDPTGKLTILPKLPSRLGGDIAPNILPNLPEYSTFPQHYCSNYKLKPYQYIN